MIQHRKTIKNWDDVPIVVDIAFVSRLLGQSYETVKRHCQSGRLPAFKTGKEWRLSKTALQNYIEGNIPQ